MEHAKWDLMDVTGGHNDGPAATHIGDNQFAELVNFYTYNGKVYRRRGVKRVTSTEYADRLTSLFTYKDIHGNHSVVVGAEQSLAKLDGTALTEISYPPGLPAKRHPWHFRQYKDVIYAVRKETAGLLRGTPDSFTDAGIEAPSTAPVIADGAAGVVLAGDYRAVVVFKNSQTGQRSNPSPVSNTLTSAGTVQIDWSDIPVSTDAQVDTRELYRTQKDQQGVYYLVGTIEDNFTTTFTEEALVADMGRSADFDNDRPPDNLELLEVQWEQLWMSDGNLLYWTPENRPESVPAANVMAINEDDGHKITAIHAWTESKLVVAKTKGVFYLTKAGGNKYPVKTLEDKRGCRSPHSMKSTQGMLFWYDGDDVCMSTGGPAEVISDPQVRDILDAIPDADKDKLVGAIFPELHWYLLVVPQSKQRYYPHKSAVIDYIGGERVEDLSLHIQTELGDSLGQIIAYSWKDRSWSVFEYPLGATFIGDFFDSTANHVLYGCFGDGYLYQHHYPDYHTDWGTKIESRFLTKAFDGGRPGFLVAPKRVALLCSSYRRLSDVFTGTQAISGYYLYTLSEMQLQFWKDGTFKKARTISLHEEGDHPDGVWRYRSLSNRSPHYPDSSAGNFLQIGFRSTVSGDFWFSALIIEATLVTRRKRVR